MFVGGLANPLEMHPINGTTAELELLEIHDQKTFKKC